jgi:hypothetical protein
MLLVHSGKIMNAPVIFGLLVRGVGVFLLYQAVHSLVGLINIFLISMPNLQGMGMGRSGVSAFLNVVLLAGAAAWFLFGAPPIQQWAYPEKDSANAGLISPGKPQIVCDGPPCVACGKSIPQDAKTCPHCGWTQP